MSGAGHHRARTGLWVLAALLLALALIGWALSQGPLREWLDVARVARMLAALAKHYGDAVGVTLFALACVLGVPLSFITVVSMVAYGPWAGSLHTLAGGLIGSAISYGLGHGLGHRAIRHLAGEKLNLISQRLASRGVLAACLIRLVPIAPFAIVNMIAGSSHMRFRDFMIGGTLGRVPGTLLMALCVDSLLGATGSDGLAQWAELIAALVLLVIGGVIAHRLAGGREE